ncbi:hypothetical protein HDU78_004750 [Chytriomyces hyalinus]|nr:hypothetical protein HDU78_004750 [Chytriomyces hyalinus]
MMASETEPATTTEPVSATHTDKTLDTAPHSTLSTTTTTHLLAPDSQPSTDPAALIDLLQARVAALEKDKEELQAALQAALADKSSASKIASKQTQLAVASSDLNASFVPSPSSEALPTPSGVKKRKSFHAPGTPTPNSQTSPSPQEIANLIATYPNSLGYPHPPPAQLRDGSLNTLYYRSWMDVVRYLRPNMAIETAQSKLLTFKTFHNLTDDVILRAQFQIDEAAPGKRLRASFALPERLHPEFLRCLDEGIGAVAHPEGGGRRRRVDSSLAASAIAAAAANALDDGKRLDKDNMVLGMATEMKQLVGPVDLHVIKEGKGTTRLVLCKYCGVTFASSSKNKWEKHVIGCSLTPAACLVSIGMDGTTTGLDSSQGLMMQHNMVSNHGTSQAMDLDDATVNSVMAAVAEASDDNDLDGSDEDDSSSDDDELDEEEVISENVVASVNSAPAAGMHGAGLAIATPSMGTNVPTPLFPLVYDSSALL